MNKPENSFLKASGTFLTLLIIIVLWPFDVSARIYSIHFASYKLLSQAEMDLEKLRSQGYEAFVRETDVAEKGRWYRVYAGKYNTRKAAAAAAAEMNRRQHIDKIFIHYFDDVNSKPSVNKDLADKSSSVGSSSSKIVIIGDKASRQYYLPGMSSSSRVKKHNRIAFLSEREAIGKGYTKADVGAQKAASEVQQQKKMPEQVGSLSPQDRSDAPAKQKVIKQKEAFKSLLMGDEKLMPKPPRLIDDHQSSPEIFKEPDETALPEPASDSDLYNKAYHELKEKKYEQALASFKEFISREDTDKQWGQRALRHMADCHYYLGKKGNKQNLLIAAEFYKNTLESFPDRRRENALTYYRLARTYEHLQYYPEAVKQYQNLLTQYPDTSYAPEAYYKIGDIYYQDGKYAQAAESLIRYLMKYRGKVNGKKAFYLIAHSFYKAKQSANAEIWFREAKQKWPDWTDIPKELVLDYGLHKTSLRRYDEALDAFSYYVNLYPNDEKIKEVSMLLANAYREAGQFSPSLAVYSRIIDHYPDTKEAKESMLAMATLGVDQPGIKAFRFLNNIHYYKNPMDTYDTLIMKNAKGDIAEEAMLQKAAALVKKGEGRKAADIYLEYLNLHPESKRVVDAAKGLKSASAQLIDDYFAKKDYLAVAFVYFKSYGAVALQAEEHAQVNKIALSLKELGLMDDYLNILNQYLKVSVNESIINKVSLDIAEGLIIQRKYDDARNMLNALAVKPSVQKSVLLTAIQKNLAEIAYGKQQYDQAVANYDAVVRSGQELPQPGRVYINYARSLHEQKKNDQALQNYLTAVKYLKDEKGERMMAGIAYKEIGDLYLHSDNLSGGLDMYNKALTTTAKDGELKYWSQFLVGKTYMKMNRNEQAQSIFAQMKAAAGAEGFWSNVVDFYVADAQWWNTYGDLVNP